MQTDEKLKIASSRYSARLPLGGTFNSKRVLKNHHYVTFL
jgi:hypothetical protein